MAALKTACVGVFIGLTVPKWPYVRTYAELRATISDNQESLREMYNFTRTGWYADQPPVSVPKNRNMD